MSTVTSHTPGTVCWIDLMTTDAAAAREFYGALFGWVFDESGPEFGHYSVGHKDGHRAIGLGPIPPGQEMPAAWSVYFWTDDIDATATAITEAGGTLIMPPMDVGEPGHMTVAQDPTGAVFGVWQPKEHRGFQIINEPGAFAWSECNTPDADDAAAFYGKVFDVTHQRLEGGMPTTYYTLHKGEAVVAGVLQMNEHWAGVPPHWMVYLAVSDIDVSVEQVKTLGGKVAVMPFPTPYGRISIVTDPQGATFTLIQLTQPG